MKLQWYGHSCFLLTAENGTRILTDPCEQKTGYDLHDIACEVVTCSHGHYDHNYTAAAIGDPTVLNEAGSYEIGGVRFATVQTFHDEEQGAKRGKNLIFLYEIDGLRIAHFGDLGHDLSEEQIAAVGKIDILLCPVGGVFTVDADGAAKLEAQIHPKVFVPMHYKTPHLSFDLGTVETFLEKIPARSIEKLGVSEWTVTKDTLPEQPTAVVFEYEVL